MSILDFQPPEYVADIHLVYPEPEIYRINYYKFVQAIQLHHDKDFPLKIHIEWFPMYGSNRFEQQGPYCSFSLHFKDYTDERIEQIFYWIISSTCANVREHEKFAFYVLFLRTEISRIQVEKCR